MSLHLSKAFSWTLCGLPTDAAPLENHHAAFTFRLLRHKDMNFLQHLPRERMVSALNRRA
jgi:hypothetical protein